MNKIITILFILWISDCKAATGNANDGPLLSIVVIGLILLIVGAGYFIDLMKSKLKEFRKRKLIKRSNSDHEDEFVKSFTMAIHEPEGISTY